MCIVQKVERIMIILMNCSVKYFVFKCERKPQITKWCASPPKSARGSTKRSRSRSAGMLSEAGQTMEMPSVMRHHGLLLGGPATSVVGCGGVVCQAEWQRAIPSRRWSGRRGSFTAKICPDRRAPDTLFTSEQPAVRTTAPRGGRSCLTSGQRIARRRFHLLKAVINTRQWL